MARWGSDEGGTCGAAAEGRGAEGRGAQGKRVGAAGVAEGRAAGKFGVNEGLETMLVRAGLGAAAVEERGEGKGS